MNTGGSVLLDTNIVVARFRNDIDLAVQLRSASALYLAWIVSGELSYEARVRL
jgi:predicted nucleic acid-binding protein